MRIWRGWFPIMCVAFATPGVASEHSVPLLAPAVVPDEVLHRCDGRKLEELLKERLRGARRFRLGDDPEEAALTLEITNCTLQETRTTTGGETSTPVIGPAGQGAAHMTQVESGISMHATQRVVLRARVGSAGRFVQVASGPKDQKLSDAVDSVRKAIDRALEEKGDWLLGTSP